MNGYIGYAGGINLHEYVGGHSLSAVDPSGLDKNVFPLYPEVGPFPGWTGWNYNGKPYQVSPDFQGRWRNATNRSPSSEFCSYFNPQSYTADDLAKEFERGVRHWERSSKVYDCSLNPYDSETGWQMDSRAAYESGLERGMRLSNVVMTVAPLLPKFRLPGGVFAKPPTNPSALQLGDDFLRSYKQPCPCSKATPPSKVTPPCKPTPPVIYKGGSGSPSNLEPRATDDGMLSFQDALVNPIIPGVPGPMFDQPLFKLGKDFIAVDTSKLPLSEGSIDYFGDYESHVFVRNISPENIKSAIIPKGPGGSGKCPK